MEKTSFSVDAKKKVVFAKGNLQYQASTGKWRFAEHQYDFIGEGNNDPDPDDWVDLFVWDKGHNPSGPFIGGEGFEGWHLLNQCEWGDLFFDRKTKSGMSYTKAKVHGVNGLVLVPDLWDGSDYEFKGADNWRTPFADNIITDEQWEALEKAGVVFLPAGGYDVEGEDEEGVSHAGEHGTYWTSSPMGDGSMHFVFFDQELFIDELEREFKCSIRLVRPVK